MGCLHDSGGNGPTLMSAASFDDTTRVVELLHKGADPHAKDNKGRTALMIAEAAGYSETVGVLVNAQDKDGATPLIIAMKIRDTDMVAELLNKGADPNLADNYGKTALMI